LEKVTLALNFENTNNFNNSFFSVMNTTRSFGNYFLSYANTGNNGAPVPQEFVNTQSGESSLYSFRS
jgi:hypothetical protein